MEIILRAENISRTYRTGTVEVPALKPCDITIEKGQIMLIIFLPLMMVR